MRATGLARDTIAAGPRELDDPEHQARLERHDQTACKTTDSITKLFCGGSLARLRRGYSASQSKPILARKYRRGSVSAPNPPLPTTGSTGMSSAQRINTSISVS